MIGGTLPSEHFILINYIVNADHSSMTHRSVEWVGATVIRGNFSSFVVSLITCFDLANASEWVTDGDNVQRKADLIQWVRILDFARDYFRKHCRFLIRYAGEYVTFLMSIRRSESISDTEFSALIALSFCDLGMDCTRANDDPYKGAL